ncbi:MAG: hypothetical protein HYZ27_09520 [Deltaproteobacteria bacterium]|nr:hypothetical protein [Deltaproteobacteria bacterium]
MMARFLGAALLCTLTLTGAQSAVAQSMEDEVKDMSWIGFQQFKEVSRVLVRTTEPVKYKVDTSKPNLVTLILENVNVPLKNNTRQLDTRFFDSPVRYIQPKVIEGPSPSVRIDIYLRRQVPFKEVQNDNVLSLDFQRQ